MIIAMTGPIGSGKSTVVNLLRSKADVVLEADAIAKEIIRTDKEVRSKLNEVFNKWYGKDVYDKYGEPDKELMSKIFIRPNLREEVDHIIHPKVHRYMKKHLEGIDRIGNDRFALIESPLPVMSYWDEPKTKPIIWYVHTDKIERIQRVMQRNRLSCKDAFCRVSSQPDEHYYLKEADQLIVNGDFTQLNRQTMELYNYYTIGIKTM